MKFSKLILLFTLSLAIISCKNDDNNDGGGDTSASLVGNWTGTAVDYSGTSVTDFQGQTITADFVGEAFDINYTVSFTEDPNEVVSEGTYSIELTTTILGQSTTQTVPDLEFLESGTWSRNGNELTITNNGESSTATIVELTANSLVINITDETTVSQQGATVTSTTVVVASYTR